MHSEYRLTTRDAHAGRVGCGALASSSCSSVDSDSRLGEYEPLPRRVDNLDLPRRTAALKVKLDAMPGVLAKPLAAPRSSTPSVVLYKVMGKMFAILSIRGIENVILKCDPHLAEVMRTKYEGIGHRSHLDRRFWISVNLDSDVPASEVKRLVAHSYELVRAKLTRKQKAELEALAS